jgi:hypothetical protein
MLAEAWMEDVMLDVDRSQGTKDTYQRELRVLVVPFFENFTIREVTVGRTELFSGSRGRSRRREPNTPAFQGRTRVAESGLGGKGDPARCVVFCGVRRIVECITEEDF